MAFLNFMKKRGELLTDIDLDMPPEPPKMMEEEMGIEEPIDEELTPLKKSKEERLPELPPLPEVREEGFPEIPPLPEEVEMPELEEGLPPLPEEKPFELSEGLDLPPPPQISQISKEKRGFFSFLKPKKAAEGLPLPKIEEEIPEMPPLPEAGEEFPEIPPLPEEVEVPELERGMLVPQIIEPLKPEIEKPLPKEVKPIEKIIKKFVVIDDYKQILGSISNTKGILKGIDDFFSKLEEVEGNIDRKDLELNNNLQDIQRKILFIDKTLFEEGG